MCLKTLGSRALLFMLAGSSWLVSASPGDVGLKYTYTLGNTRDGNEGLKAALGSSKVEIRLHTPTLTQSGRNRMLLHIEGANGVQTDHVIDVDETISLALLAWSSVGIPLAETLRSMTEHNVVLDMDTDIDYHMRTAPVTGIDILLSNNRPQPSNDANAMGVTDVYNRSRARRIVIYLSNIYRNATTARPRADGTTSTNYEFLRGQGILPSTMSESHYIDMMIQHTLVHELGHALGLVHPEQHAIGGFVELLDPLQSSVTGVIRGESMAVVTGHNPSIMIADASTFLVQVNSRRNAPVSIADIRPSGRDFRGVLNLWRIRPQPAPTPHPPEPQPPHEPEPPKPPGVDPHPWLAWVGAAWGNVASMRM